MPRTKLLKIKGYNYLENTFCNDCNLKNRWAKEHFRNDLPISLELGAGSASFSLELAKLNTNKNYIAIDIKADRLYNGAVQAYNKNQLNIAFLKCNIEDLNDFFAKSEISEIWITFPDPQIKKRNCKHRLLHKRFLEIYRNILAKDSKIYFKTDSDMLYNYAIEEIKLVNAKIIEISNNLQEFNSMHTDIYTETNYEKRYIAQGKTIKYICFSF